MISAGIISKPQKLVQHEKEIMISIAKKLDFRTPQFLSHCSSLSPFLNLGHHAIRLRSTMEERLYLEVEKDSSSSNNSNNNNNSTSSYDKTSPDSLRGFLLSELKVTLVAIFLQLHRDLPNSFWVHKAVAELDDYFFSFIYYKTCTIFVTIIKEFYITLDALDGSSASEWFFNTIKDDLIIEENSVQFSKLFGKLLLDRWKRLEEAGISLGQESEKISLLQNLTHVIPSDENASPVRPNEGGIQGKDANASDININSWKPSMEELDEVLRKINDEPEKTAVSKHRGGKMRLVKFGLPFLSILFYLGRFYFKSFTNAGK